MKFKFILSLIIFIVSALLCQRIISNSVTNQQNKQDSAEINNIKYGLFSVNKWKEQLTVIIVDEINKLNLTNANELQLKKHVELQLSKLIDNVDRKIRESNKGTAKGWMKQSLINTLVDMKDIKEGIPEYADAVIGKMTEAKVEYRLKNIVKERIEKYLDKTFEIQDFSHLNQTIEKMGTQDIEIAKDKLSLIIQENQKIINQETYLLIGLAIFLFVMVGFGNKELLAPLYILLLLELLVLLLTGVTTPMIDLEAKISEMRLVLLDHPITFVNQVLYFQTKSILDVFWIMINDKAIQMNFVGVLLIVFSIIFPLLKLLSSFVYYFNFYNVKENKLVQFFVLKSGKWSMTDVLVVAIFMAYIGFNGLVSSQFGSLNSTEKDLLILTTNGTTLQPGFYIFFTYSVLALVLSVLLQRKSKPL